MSKNEAKYPRSSWTSTHENRTIICSLISSFMQYTNKGTVMNYENEKEVQLMRTLINHILHNFPSNSYMVRYTFIHKLDTNWAMGPTNFIKLIKKSFTSKPKP